MKIDKNVLSNVDQFIAKKVKEFCKTEEFRNAFWYYDNDFEKNSAGFSKKIQEASLLVDKKCTAYVWDNIEENLESLGIDKDLLNNDKFISKIKTDIIFALSVEKMLTPLGMASGATTMIMSKSPVRPIKPQNLEKLNFNLGKLEFVGTYEQLKKKEYQELEEQYKLEDDDAPANE